VDRHLDGAIAHTERVGLASLGYPYQMRHFPVVCASFLLVGSSLLAQEVAPTPTYRSTHPRDDAFLAGYAAGVLEREFSLSADGLMVKDGQVHLPDRGFGRLEREEIARLLRAIPGVRGVTFDAAPVELSASDASLTAFLAPGRLFEPLLADPRWPHFYATYDYYSDVGDPSGSKPIEHVGSAGFGETLSMVRQTLGSGLRWEAGLQAGVFAIFDLDSPSKDLINADYFVGPFATFRYGDLALLTRLYHQSSHLGDEYVLREQLTGSERVNLSYEAVDAVLSWELPYGLRLYGGGGYLIDTDPVGLDPGIGQYGMEWRAPTTWGSGLRPVVAADFQVREENDWGTDTSIRAGVQFEDPNRFSQRLAVMLEYYDGRSPNGQFYTDRVEFVGLGLHFYF